MYWYYKYPAYVVLVLALFGIGYLIYSQLPGGDAAPGDGVPSEVGTGPDGGDDPDAGKGPGPGNVVPWGRGTEPRAPVGADVQRLLVAAETQLASDSLLAARALAHKVLGMTGVQVYDPTWSRATAVVGKVNTVLVNSDAPAPEKARYKVKSGDTLVDIAAAHHTTVEALQRCNKRLDPTSSTIFPGMVLNIYEGDWSILVSKANFRLVLMDGEDVFKVYQVAIGRQDRTPPGVFRVKNKLREPAWTPPGKVIPYGDPENVLGTRWLGLQPIEDTDPTLISYGIHGTWEPDSIGSAASEGCVRMLNDDVNELFAIVPVGTRVTIEGE